MATGILGRANLTAATNTSLYTVPSGKVAVFNVSFVNRGTTTFNVRLALSNSGTPADADYLEFDYPLIPGGVLERTGIVMDAAKVLVVYAAGANISAVAFGYEENA